MLGAEKSVAVLYFENLSGAKEDEYFRDGITEDVITELSKIKNVMKKVIPGAPHEILLVLDDADIRFEIVRRHLDRRAAVDDEVFFLLLRDEAVD